MKNYCHTLLTILLLLTAPCASFAQKSNSAFTEYCRKAAAESSSIAIPGKDNWAFLKSELRFLGTEDLSKDPLTAITAYSKALAAENIELILVPVPPKAVIYPDKLAGGDFAVARYDEAAQHFYEQLRKQGVDVFDITALLLQARKTSSEPLYCCGDSHFSGYACKIIADALAKELKTKHKISGNKKYDVKQNKITISGDLYKAAQNTVGNTLPKEESVAIYTVSGTGTKSGDSPVLMLGDSHTMVFDIGSDLFATNAGLPSLLAAAAGLPVDVVGVRGSGATPARINVYRKSKSDPKYLKTKKVFIWCFSAREFSEATWNPSVPIK